MGRIDQKEGYVRVKGGRVWYRIIGKGKSTPIVILHGGPGWPHDRLEPPLSELSTNRKIIFYDQLGCGKSDWPNNKSLWKLDRFVSELGILVKSLKLKEYHVFGHSFGTTIATAYAFTKPKGMKSLILSSSCLSAKIWGDDLEMLLKRLPNNMQKAIEDYKNYGKNKKKYDKALKELYDRFLYGKNMPKEYWQMTKKINFKNKINWQVYNTMWGPDEFRPTGNMKGFDFTKRLHEIKVPVLLLCGRDDEATPKSTRYFASLIPNARVKVFQKSAHSAFWTERQLFVKTIDDFLNKIDE